VFAGFGGELRHAAMVFAIPARESEPARDDQGATMRSGFRSSRIKQMVITSLLPLACASAATAPTPTPSNISTTAAAPKALTLSDAAAVLKAARFTTDGKLMKPAALDQWVFLGTSLGMGYNEMRMQSDPSDPGQFQVVLMEPGAYRYFMEHGDYAPGSMFLLSFYDSDQRRSINKTGFVQSSLASYEIHRIGAGKAEEEHQFYLFQPRDTEGNPLPKGNECVRCHVAHGAFEGTFAQFYPAIRDRIPKESLERAMKDVDIR
jgi:hypothetical protein